MTLTFPRGFWLNRRTHDDHFVQSTKSPIKVHAGTSVAVAILQAASEASADRSPTNLVARCVAWESASSAGRRSTAGPSGSLARCFVARGWRLSPMPMRVDRLMFWSLVPGRRGSPQRCPLRARDARSPWSTTTPTSAARSGAASGPNRRLERGSRSGSARAEASRLRSGLTGTRIVGLAGDHALMAESDGRLVELELSGLDPGDRRPRAFPAFSRLDLAWHDGGRRVAGDGQGRTADRREVGRRRRLGTIACSRSRRRWRRKGRRLR